MYIKREDRLFIEKKLVDDYFFTGNIGLKSYKIYSFQLIKLNYASFQSLNPVTSPKATKCGFNKFCLL